MLSTHEVKKALRILGYYGGEVDSDAMEDGFRADLRRFQRDHGKAADGWYGPKTEAALMPYVRVLAKTAPPNLGICRRWKLTYYYVGDVKRHRGPLVPMRTPDGEILASVPASAFVEAALEGATKLADGRLATVAHPAYSPVDAETFRPVLLIAKRNGWLPQRAGYAGISIDNRERTIAARNFRIKETAPNGWPAEAKGIPCDPFRTVAADNGKLRRHDPKFVSLGGVVPAGTRVWVLELAGTRLPDGRLHDGWVTVNDTGGGIFGAHFDVFVGTRDLGKRGPRIPARAHIWFEGIEGRIPENYSYGL